MRIWRLVIGSKGNQELAIRILKTLPKLEEATILMYLMPGKISSGRHRMRIRILTCCHE
jgi:hypothetical protein